MGTATSKSLKLKDVSFITCADDGAVFLNGSTREKSSWGLRRLDLATQQVSDIGDTVTRCEGPYAVLGDTVVGVELESQGKVKTIVTLDRITGEVRARYGGKFERNVIAVAASAGFIGALTADWDTQQSSLEVFDANSGKSVLKVDAAAFAFSESGDAVVYVIAAQALVHQPLGKGKATKVPFDEKFTTGLMARQGSRLLSACKLFDEKTGKRLLDLSSEYNPTTWGLTPGTLVGHGLKGVVEVVDLKGKVLKTFFRPRKSSVNVAAVSPAGWLLVSTGDFLEMYDLSEGKALAKAPPPPRAPPVKKPAPTSPAKDDPRAAKLLETFWKKPDDLQPLRVWADLLSEHGDVRAEFIQLSLLGKRTDAQYERRALLEKKEAGRLVGPARPFLRKWFFGATGLVARADCEADKLLAGFESIAALSPRLELVVTSLRKKTAVTISELVKLPLSRVWYWRLESNALSDKSVIALAPGLEGVKHLSLQFNDVTGTGLTGMAPHLTELEFLALGPSIAQSQDRPALVAGWVDALTARGAFPNLRALYLGGGVTLEGGQRKRLEAKPGMKLVKLSEYPPNGEDIEAWKRGED